MSRVLSILTLSLFCSLNPAWGGGWESSGSRAQDPIQPTTRPATTAHFECYTTLRHESATGNFEEFSRSDELMPEQFKSGIATIITDGAVDGKSHAGFLVGHTIQLNVRDNLQGLGGTIALTISASHRSHRRNFVSSTVVRTDRNSPAISANIETKLNKSTISLDVVCRDLAR